jgi:hypothetical protein
MKQVGFACDEATRCGVQTAGREEWRLCVHPECPDA